MSRCSECLEPPGKCVCRMTFEEATKKPWRPPDWREEIATELDLEADDLERNGFGLPDTIHLLRKAARLLREIAIHHSSTERR